MLYAVIAAWLMATIGTVLAMRYARSRALLDQPGERRSHDVPTPRGGGVAIVLAVVVVGLGVLVATPTRPDGLAAVWGAALAGFLVVAAVGWLDDHRPMSVRVRLLVHVGAAGLFSAVSWFATGDALITVVAFLAPLVLTNVWNFMDGINGIASTQAIAVAIFLSLALTGTATTLALALAAATWAFLPYNFPRARIFLGDVGSGALGYFLGVLFTLAVWRKWLQVPGIGGAVLLALPLSAFLIDASFTLARRILHGERWWTPHVQHAYQVSSRRLGHAWVTMGFLGWTVLACLLAVSARAQSELFALVMTVGWYTLGVFAWWYIQRWARAGKSAVRNGIST